MNDQAFSWNEIDIFRDRFPEKISAAPKGKWLR
jgi:hypothetical protein